MHSVDKQHSNSVFSHGRADFKKRAAKVCGVPRSTLKKWGQQYLKGIYLCRIVSSSGYTDTKRMTLLK